MKSNIPFFILAIIILQSCNLSNSRTWINDHIDKTKRDEIKSLNDHLVKALVNNDVADLKTLMADKLLEKGGKTLDTLVNQVSTVMKMNSYSVLDEYNIKNSTDNVASTLPSSETGENAFTINFLSLNKEMYASLLLPNGTKNNLMIVAIYGKYGDKWQLNILELGLYSYFGKNAIDYYKLAKSDYAKSRLIDAVDNISVAKECLRPGNNYFQYKKEEEVNKFYDKLIQEANAKYIMPLTLENIASKPKIFNVRPQVFSDGIFPMVSYLSEINLKDTIALKAENVQVKKEVDRIFTGIDQNKKFVFYQAFNEMPDGKKILSHYGFMEEFSN